MKSRLFFLIACLISGYIESKERLNPVLFVEITMMDKRFDPESGTITSSIETYSGYDDDDEGQELTDEDLLIIDQLKESFFKKIYVLLKKIECQLNVGDSVSIEFSISWPDGKCLGVEIFQSGFRPIYTSEDLNIYALKKEIEELMKKDAQ